jgi:hypothetical protein
VNSGDDLRLGGERTVADGAIAATQVDHRREAQVDAAGAHFARHQPGMFLGQRDRTVRIAAVELAELVQRRQRAVALAEALHATAFLVHADAAAGAGAASRMACDSSATCRREAKVAGEQDHAGAGRVLQPLALLRGEFGAGDADHEHAGTPWGQDGRS